MKKYYRLLIVCIGILFVIRLADAHSVGQVQTTKFFAPETIQLLENRISNGQPAGFVVGDILTYIIQFTPVANNANIGVAGYVTDYIPPGVEVVGADIVTLSGVDVNGADIYSPIAPQLPGGIDLGWGNQGANTYLAPFDSTATYDITGRCHALTLMNNCNGRLTELHADTGIFFSTDPRTAVYPALPQRIAQGTNGYKIQPTAAGQLNPIIGQPQATTHNLWDADQTNAFGSKQADIDNLTQPKSSAIDLTNGKGRGPAPYNAGSPVAGPQTGYTQDNTAGIGPWRRIYYPGSRIGDPTTGPATAALVSTTALGGLPTNLGVTLSTSNPLPAGTNAVRWAVGRLVVGQNSYVRIRLRITQPVPAGGLVNSSEVFGGDAGDGAAGGYNNDGQDNPWRYHVPSVADNNSNLYVKKIACVYSPTASTCTPLSGAYHPGATTITYQITYLNSGNVAQTNVALSDIVPCDTDAGMTAVVGTVTGPLAVLVTLPLSTSITNGTCASPPTRHTVTFPTIATLNPGEGGRVIINIPNNANVENKSVINTARLTSSQVPSGVSSNAVTYVGDNGNPALVVSKTTPQSTNTAGGTALYVITVQNTGTGPAAAVQIDDFLPSSGGNTTNTTTRFNYLSLASVTATSFTTGSFVVSTTTAAASGLTPYNTAPGATNTVRINFNFGAGSSLAAGGRITLSFVASIGSAMNASALPYYNKVVARGGTYRVDSGDTAPVVIQSALQVSKQLECYYLGGICTPVNSAGDIPPHARVRYRIDYANTGGALSSVVLTDTLPCQMSSTSPALTVSAVLSGPIAPTGTTPYAVPGVFTGACPNTRASFSFPPATLAAGQTGSLQIEAQLSTPANTSNVVINDVRLSAPGASTVTAQVQNTVIASAQLQIDKTVSPAVAPPGTTLTYTITVRNTGTTAAQTVTVYDILPTGNTTTVDLTRRFSYSNGSSLVTGSLTSVAPTTRTGPNLQPYDIGPYASNQEQISWTFAGQTLPVGGVVTIQFTAQVGSNLPALAPPNYYNNYAVVTYHNAQQASSNASSANVSLAANLSISKTNATNTLASGQSTAYTVTVANGGPSAANGAVVKDVASAGLQCVSVSCAQTTGAAACPVALPLGSTVLTGASNFFSTGEALPAFPANSSVTFVVRCNVVASGE